MAQLLDFSASLIDPQAIKDAGFAGVIGYFSDRRPGAEWMQAKPLTRDYCDRLRAHGLEIVTNFQFNKGGNDTSDWLGGFAAGQANARRALELHFAAGGPPNRPLYCAIDSAPTLDMWNSTVADYVRGWASIVGLEWTGIYANADMIDNAIQDGVATWFWQHNNLGYASDHPDHPAAHIHQIRIDSDTVAGVGVDVNITFRDDYGQWSKAAVVPSPPPVQGDSPVADQPAYTELDRMGDSRSNRFAARITNFLLHTQEGDGTAESLAAYLNNTANGASYHYTVRDGIVCDVVDTDYASWSVLDANSRTINLCFAGSRASWSREQWLEIEDDIKIACWLAVQDARKYGFATDVITPDYQVGDGISDHKYVTQALNIGTHTDVGYNFPWDTVQHWVGVFSGATPVPVAPQGNAINDCAAANTWLGDRVTVGENSCPDGAGRFAQFNSGYVYWHPRTGAFAVPLGVFETWARLGWEAGALGYPIGVHTDLPAGVVQGFEGGAIYRQTGRPGFWVHGEIRNRWNRSGFENGPLGWPVADEEPFDGGARQRFEKGSIYWPGKRATLALLDAGAPDAPLPDVAA
jgi:hypothetical protein